MKPNVLIITFDCLRPDRLGFAGYKGVETPTFDRLAEESLVFENAYCQCPNTWISHASMFTGCLPPVHGVRTPLRKLRPEVPTLAEVLRDNGYATFGLPATTLLSEDAGFGRGFDAYDLEDLHGHRTLPSVRHFRSTDLTLEKFQRFLDTRHAPFFAWVHYFGIHKLDADLLELPSQYRKSFSEYAQYYDGKVSHADAAFLGPLVDMLESRSLMDNTLLILWSDHGEDLALVDSRLHSREHGFALDEDTVRTLLMVRTPRAQGAGRRTDIANSIDIFPTICEVCEVPCPETAQGRALLSEGESPAAHVAYFENLCQGFLGLRSGEWKLVLTNAPPMQSQLESGEEKQGALRDKFRWRWDLITDTLGKVVRSSKGNLRRHGRVYPGLRHWWRAQKEPEQVARELFASGRRELWRFEDDEARRVYDLSRHQDIVRDLSEIVRRLSLPKEGSQFLSLSKNEQDRLKKDLSALGYM